MSIPTRRVTLIHNAAAGGGDHDYPQMVALIEEAGYIVVRHDAKDPDIAAALKAPTDIVAVAGGDGTVRRVVSASHADGPPIAILPLGRANNIAKSLGVVGSAERLIAGWRNARHRPFFPIAAEGPWGRQRLVEGLGFGALAQAIDELRGGKLSVEEARRRVAALIMHADPEALDVRADGAAISGLFVVFEVMTIRLVGPNLLLASCADPADGLVLSSVGASIDERQRLAGWLRQPEPVAPAPVTTRTARHVTVSGRPRRIRIDDQVRRNDEGGCETISLAPEEKPLYFLVPI